VELLTAVSALVTEMAVSPLEELVTGVISFDKRLLTGVAPLFSSGVPTLVPVTTGDSLASSDLLHHLRSRMIIRKH